MDNLLIGTENDDVKHKREEEAERIIKAAFINLRSFALNDPEVTSIIPKSDQDTEVEQSLLGLIWNRENDTSSIQLKAFEGSTKRELAQFIANHFDLLELLFPIFLFWKVFCQELWIDNVQWDNKFYQI